MLLAPLQFGCGEWKAPVINNPEYKGKWSAPKVDNPDYKGVWAPAKIDNPHYFTDDSPHAMAPVGGVGIEIWTMQDGILFDNIVLTHDASVASGLAAKTFVHRKTIEELKKKEESRKNALDGEEAKGMAGAIKKYALKAWYYAQDNPAIVGGSIFLGLIPILLLCCFPFGGKKGAGEPKGEPAEDADADSEGEGEEEEEGEEEPIEEVEEEPEPEPPKAETKKGGAKKRTPKAS